MCCSIRTDGNTNTNRAFFCTTSRLDISSSDFLTILSSLTTQNKSNRDLSVLLEDASKLLVERYVLSAPKTSSTFTTLFKNIQFIAKPELIYFGLILCLTEDPECWTAWRGLYKKNIQQTTDLLSFIGKFSTACMVVDRDLSITFFVFRKHFIEISIEAVR